MLSLSDRSKAPTHFRWKPPLSVKALLEHDALVRARARVVRDEAPP